MKLSRGVFITFEGDDGVGKSTQAALLAKWLRDAGREVLCVREPGATNIGEKLRGILLDPQNTEMCDMCELLIYEAARAQLVNQVLIPALEADKIVICDRFIDSTMAYQSAGRGIDPCNVRVANDLATGGLMPNLTILLSLPDQKEKDRRISDRGFADRLELAGDDFHRRVSAAFAHLAADFPERVVEIRTAYDPEDTARAITDAVFERFPDIAGE